MEALIMAEDGSGLKLAERSIPTIGPREVLIKVAAAGVNYPDIIQAQGKYPAPEGVVQDIPGLEASGEIVLLGDEVTNWKVGDKVCALVAGGAYAEYLNIPDGQCLPVPEGVSLEEAASLPETYFTVFSNLVMQNRMKSGDTVLIHGGSGGIGSAAIAIGKALGATIIVTAGSDEKCSSCIELGADMAINYNKYDFESLIKERYDKVDIILDVVGGQEYTDKHINLLAKEGRWILLNAMQGANVKINLMKVMMKRIRITGSTLRSRSISYKTEIADRLKNTLWKKFKNKEIKLHSIKYYPLDEGKLAHEEMINRKHIGKLVLLPNT
ncbi:MAG: NAD(P)H-quinone oxidoreductase [Cyclobacteriaceae bacterium]|nr:NAD(P)H-quinone oxidoreductase [Cyclobacteriaceae bacterium]